jgi:hypothetical protein
MGPGARQGQRDDATHAPSRAGHYGDLVLKWTIVHHACIDITPQRNVKPVCFGYNPQIPQMTQINASLDSSASSAQSADLFLPVHRLDLERLDNRSNRHDGPPDKAFVLSLTHAG